MRVRGAAALVAAAVLVAGCEYLPWTAEYKAKETLNKLLFDPGSAQIRNVRRDKADVFVCGEFNAKNRMGGYAGFKAFVYNIKYGQLVMDPVHNPCT